MFVKWILQPRVSRRVPGNRSAVSKVVSHSAQPYAWVIRVLRRSRCCRVANRLRRGCDARWGSTAGTTPLSAALDTAKGIVISQFDRFCLCFRSDTSRMRADPPDYPLRSPNFSLFAMVTMSIGAASSGGSRSTTVVLADDSRMGCQLLADTIQRHNHFRVVASATARKEVIYAVRKLQPDIAVISARLQDGAFAGLKVLLELHTLQTRPRVIMLLDDDQPRLVVEAFRNGARGIFCRTGVTTGLRKCIQCVYDGQIWANNTQLEHIVEALMQAPVPGLAKTSVIRALGKREEEIARLVASGLSNREIAQRLSISPHTVKNYLFRVFEKLGISTRIELVLYILSQCNGPECEQNEIAETTFKMRRGCAL